MSLPVVDLDQIAAESAGSYFACKPTSVEHTLTAAMKSPAPHEGSSEVQQLRERVQVLEEQLSKLLAAQGAFTASLAGEKR